LAQCNSPKIYIFVFSNLLYTFIQDSWSIGHNKHYSGADFSQNCLIYLINNNSSLKSAVNVIFVLLYFFDQYVLFAYEIFS